MQRFSETMLQEGLHKSVGTQFEPRVLGEILSTPKIRNAYRNGAKLAKRDGEFEFGE